MAKLGTVRKLGFDRDGYERRKRLEALAECPKCGKEIECWAETDEWFLDRDHKRHCGYGGAMGVCEECRILIADCPTDGLRSFDLSKR